MHLLALITASVLIARPSAQPPAAIRPSVSTIDGHRVDHPKSKMRADSLKKHEAASTARLAPARTPLPSVRPPTKTTKRGASPLR